MPEPSESWRNLLRRPWVSYGNNGWWKRCMFGWQIGNAYDPHLLVYVGPWYLALTWRGWEVL